MKPTLKDLREESGLSQSQVAEALGIPAYQLVSNWERGKSRPNLDHVVDLADLYKRTTKQIVQAVKNTSASGSNCAQNVAHAPGEPQTPPPKVDAPGAAGHLP